MKPLAIFATLLALGAAAPSAPANGWQQLSHQPTGRKASTAFLLMDGRVLMNDNLSTKWWILTPTITGSYTDGTWSAAATANDSRLYYASGVLGDGRVIIAGGEYGTGTDTIEIYDPVLDTWTLVAKPTGWGSIADAPSVVLPDGRFMLAEYFTPRVAIYDPKTNAWTSAADKLNSSSVEETWTVLPDGTVLSVDCPGHPGSELYDPVADTWTSLGNTPVDLVDGILEIGSALMMNNGEVVCFGATPHVCHYTPSTTPGGVGTWVQSTDPPLVGGKAVSNYDSCSALLPNGNLLVTLGLGFSAPYYMYEYDGSNWIDVPDPANSGHPAYEARLLLLPTGKVLNSCYSVSIYTPDGSPDPTWAPTITSVPTDLIPGVDYKVFGTQLNGRSTACSYGDECNMATNYPIVKIKFTNSGHTSYCRAHDPSTMGYMTGSAIHSTHFVVPSGEIGPAKLTVIANGIASAEVDVVVRDPVGIDFDTLATGVAVTSQYAEAAFSSSAGFENIAVASANGATAPNMLCTAPLGGAADCTHDTFIDFPCPIASLTFHAIGVDNVGSVATVDVYSNGLLAGSVDVVGAGTPATPLLVDCTAFGDVSRVEIKSISDVGGVAWDDFQFCLATTASWSNYGAGLAGTLGVPSFTVSVPPILGTTMTADLGNSLGAATLALVMVGDSTTSLPFKGGTLLVDADLSFLLTLNPGSTPLDADIDNDPALCGVSFFAQALEVDVGAPQKISFTQGLELVLGN